MGISDLEQDRPRTLPKKRGNTNGKEGEGYAGQTLRANRVDPVAEKY